MRRERAGSGGHLHGVRPRNIRRHTHGYPEPVLDGYAATAAIRASHSPESQTIPIIAMTANAFHEDVVSALSAGMNSHISKPIDPERLYRAVASLRDKRSQPGLRENPMGTAAVSFILP